MEASAVRIRTIGTVRMGVILLALATAAVHLYLGTGRVDVGFGEGVNPIFIVNGVGYAALLAALYALPSSRMRFRGIVRWVLLGYTAITVLLWALGGPRIPIAYADKAIELLLIALLLLDAREGRRTRAAQRS